MNLFWDFMKKYGWILLGFFAIFPLFINQLYGINYFHEMYDPKLSIKEWLLFWTAFVGPAIGGIVALFAVYSSLKQNEKFHINTINIQKNIIDFRRRELMPVLDFKPKDVDFVIGKLYNEGLCGLYISIEDHLKDPKYCYETMQFSKNRFQSPRTGIDIKDIIVSLQKQRYQYVIFELNNIGLSVAFCVNVVLAGQKNTQKPIKFTNQIPKDGKEFLILNFCNETITAEYTVLITYIDTYNCKYVQRIDIITPKDDKNGLIFNRYIPVNEEEYRTMQKMRTEND